MMRLRFSPEASRLAASKTYIAVDKRNNTKIFFIAAVKDTFFTKRGTPAKKMKVSRRADNKKKMQEQ